MLVIPLAGLALVVVVVQRQPWSLPCGIGFVVESTE